MSTPSPRSFEARDADGNGLRLGFDWHFDRWSHEVTWLSADGRTLGSWRSCEGDLTEAWPPSPPFQELSVESRGAIHSHVALLLGSAGKSHWSASMELQSRPLQLSIDVACRISETHQELGSRYLVDCDPDVEATISPMDVMLRADACLRFAAGQGDLAVSNAQPCEVNIRPSGSAPPATVRWSYQFLITPVSEVDPGTGA